MRTRIFVILSFVSLISYGQQGSSEFIHSVDTNNLELQAARRLLEAEKLSNRTGMYPENPFVEYGFFQGDGAEVGTKSEFSITQSFQFPTVYGIRKKIAKQQDNISEHEYKIVRKEVLFEARLLNCKRVYLQKKEKEFSKRLAQAERLYAAYKQKISHGNTSIPAYNKAYLAYLGIKSEIEILKQDIENNQRELEIINGGKALEFNGFEYQEEEILPLDTILYAMQNSDPTLVAIEEQLKYSDLAIKLQNQTWIPEFELGYAQENEPLATFRGFKFGVSIPLWRDLNEVKLAKAQQFVIESELELKKQSSVLQATMIYQKVLEYNEILSEYKDALSNVDNTAYLNKSLSLGKISILEYYNELSFYFQAIDRYLDIEYEYHQSLIQLYSYK